MRRLMVSILCCLFYLSRLAFHVESAHDESIVKRALTFLKLQQSQQAPLTRSKRYQYRRKPAAYVHLEPLAYPAKPQAAGQALMPIQDDGLSSPTRHVPIPPWSDGSQASVKRARRHRKEQPRELYQRLLFSESARSDMVEQSDGHALVVPDDVKEDDDNGDGDGDMLVPFRPPNSNLARLKHRIQQVKMASSPLLQDGQAKRSSKLSNIDPRHGRAAQRVLSAKGNRDPGRLRAASLPLVQSPWVASAPLAARQDIRPSQTLVRNQQEKFHQELGRLHGKIQPVSEDGWENLRLPLDDKFVIPLDVYDIKGAPFDSGTYGQVYFARSKYNPHDCVVLKRMDEAVAKSSLDDVLDRDPFNELQILTTRLPAHPSIVQIIGFSYDRFWPVESNEDRSAPLPIPSAVLKFCHGGTLRKQVVNRIRAPIAQVEGDAPQYPKYPPLSQRLHRENIQWMYDILSGLLHLKTHHVMHRDLKSENILLVSDDGRYRAVMADFGLAIDLEDRGVERYELSIDVYTTWYRAPEIMAKWYLRELTGRIAASTEYQRQDKLEIEQMQHDSVEYQSRMQTYEKEEGVLKGKREKQRKLKRKYSEEYSYPAEVWSAAIIMIELYTGHNPFEIFDDDWIRVYDFMRRNMSPVFDKNHEVEFSAYLESVRQSMDHDAAFDLLVWMLRVNPRNRISVESILQHRYFDSLL